MVVEEVEIKASDLDKSSINELFRLSSIFWELKIKDFKVFKLNSGVNLGLIISFIF